MSHHNHHGQAFGAFAIIAAIAWVFGPRTAKTIVGALLLAGAAAFVYVMFRIVMGTI